MAVYLTPEQIKRFEVIQWLLHPRGNRATGRTHLMALAFISHAINTGEWIEIFNHDTHLQSNREILRRTVELSNEFPEYHLEFRGRMDDSKPRIKMSLKKDAQLSNISQPFLLKEKE